MTRSKRSSTPKPSGGGKDKASRVRIGMVSLGCPKTLVDSEIILGKVAGPGYELTASADECDVVLLNTCAFVGDAQKESVDKILEMVELKKQGRIKALVVMGCLVQRFPDELQAELGEVDAFVGSGDYAGIRGIVDRVVGGERAVSVGEAGYLTSAQEERVALTPLFSRYVKISEGCDHICTFCTIPSFRGKHRSRTIEDVEQEVQRLASLGAREVLLTGQDTTYFGRDHTGQFLLPELLRRLDRIDGIEWIRLLYAYPSCINRELMETMRDAVHVLPYLDMPLQHASDRMLEAMKRGITRRRTEDLIRDFRETVSGLAIRTTFIVGFPGETEKDFEELLSFMEAMAFERAGVFMYSQEEGTPAAAMPDQVSDEVKQDRFERAMLMQQEISARRLKAFIGRQMQVLVEGQSDEEKDVWVARSYLDAPEIDGSVFVTSARPLQTGSFYNVTITGAGEYDLLGRT